MYYIENNKQKEKCLKRIKDIEKQNALFLQQENRIKSTLCWRIIFHIKRFQPLKLKAYISAWVQSRMLQKKYLKSGKSKLIIPKKRNIDREESYFTNERIAVYTCITGGYDKLVEPVLKPDNIDYYVITDMSVPTESRWKKIDVKNYKSFICGLDEKETNRFFKMHPHIIFSDYKYSIYVDGNIKVVSDVTKYVNRMCGKCCIAAFEHPLRSDAVQEAIYCVRKRKDTKDNIEKHIQHLIEVGMPDNYGLVECSVLVREHNKECENLMDEWWEEYLHYSKRDQVSLPYVLWKNNITVDEVAVLGENLLKDAVIRKVSVNHKGGKHE